MIGYIYKLVNDVDERIYVGSTTKQLAERLSKHHTSAKLAESSQRKVYAELLKIGFHKVRIELLEEVHCRNAIELRQFERKWIDVLRPSLNTNRSFITDEERRTNHTVLNAERRKQLRTMPTTCFCGSNITKLERTRHVKSKKHRAAVNAICEEL